MVQIFKKNQHIGIKMRKLIFIIAMVGMLLAGCKESEDARRINEYFSENGIEEKVQYRNRAQAADGIFSMIFQNSYFKDNPKAAADFITSLGYYEVVLRLEGTLLLHAVEDEARMQIKHKYSEKYGMINSPYPSSGYDPNHATHTALLCLINIFSLPEKTPIAQDALELFKTILEKMENTGTPGYSYNGVTYWDATEECNKKGLTRGFAVFTLAPDTPSDLGKYYPRLYKNPEVMFPYLADLRSAPEGFKEIITNTPSLKSGGFRRPFLASEKLFESFKATSPKKGGYVFEYDDPLAHTKPSRLYDYKTDILYPVSNPNNASIIIREKYTYQDITGLYFPTPSSKVYLKHTNVQVKDAVSGKILFNRTFKSTAGHLLYENTNVIDDAFTHIDRNNYVRNLFPDMLKEIEAIATKL